MLVTSTLGECCFFCGVQWPGLSWGCFLQSVYTWASTDVPGSALIKRVHSGSWVSVPAPHLPCLSPEGGTARIYGLLQDRAALHRTLSAGWCAVTWKRMLLCGLVLWDPQHWPHTHNSPSLPSLGPARLTPPHVEHLRGSPWLGPGQRIPDLAASLPQLLPGWLKEARSADPKSPADAISDFPGPTATPHF